jgi:Zn-dependent peptidase ImmA (M78 family)
MTTIEVFGERVRQARVLRRMTGKAVMDEMGWKAPRQTRLERAQVTTLDMAEMERLAEVLRFPLEFFTTAPTTRVSTESLLFRAPKSTTASEKEYLAQFAALVSDFLDELDTRWRLPPVKLPVLNPDTPVDVAAAKVRHHLGFAADEPIPYLMYEIERCGVPVVMRHRRTQPPGQGAWDPNAGSGEDDPLERHLGYSTWVGEFGERPLVVLKSSESWERTRWTLAHEMGHLALHADSVVNTDHEEQASRFASELLAPAAAIADEVPKMPSLLNLMPLKQMWGISIGALVRHLHESKLIDTNRYEMLRRQLYTRINPQTGHTWGRTEPGWDDREPERPRLMAKWVERCFGATSATMLAPHRLRWPQDLLDAFLAGQRAAPTVARSTTLPVRRGQRDEDGLNVVDFDRFRQDRRA